MAGGAGRRGREGQVQVSLFASGDCSRRAPKGKGTRRSAGLGDWFQAVYNIKSKLSMKVGPHD